MTCRAWQHLLQQHLDGDSAAALEQHVQGCSDCAAEQPALRRFLEGVALLAPPVPPDDLAGRIADQLCALANRRRRQRQRRLVAFAGMAAAAAVLIAVGVRIWQPARALPADPRPLPVVKTPRPAVEPTRPLRDSMADAGTAVASLTSRTAGATMDQTASLLPILPAPAIEPLAVVPAPMEPLREASAGVSAGLAPVADSARRAVGLFLRDFPMGRTDSPPAPEKPG